LTTPVLGSAFTAPLLAQVGRIADLFDGLGALVILVGAALTLVRAAAALRSQGGQVAYQLARRSFGQALLLGLEVLIAADLLRSVALNLSLTSIASLGLLVVVRTILSFSVQIELEGELPWRLARRRRRG
jgi:uncharacterized membrane protein